MDSIPNEWIALIPHWLLFALLIVFGTPGFFSYVVGFAKWCTGLPKPGDSVARKRWFAVLRVGDVIAGNTAKVVCQLQTLQHRQELIAQQKVIAQQHAVIAEQERAHVALVTALKQEAP